MQWRKCKCPDEEKQLRVWEKYLGRRVHSPLVDLAAWHKKSVLVIVPPHLTRLTVTGVWQPDNWVRLRPAQDYSGFIYPGFTLLETEQCDSPCSREFSTVNNIIHHLATRISARCKGSHTLSKWSLWNHTTIFRVLWSRKREKELYDWTGTSFCSGWTHF